MKKNIVILFFTILSLSIYSQTTPEVITGKVSYISSQNVYVKFDNTEGIHVGDTLFTVKNEKTDPVLLVTSLSSISVVGTLISPNSLTSDSQIIAKKRIIKPEISDDKLKISPSANEEAIINAFKKEKETESRARFDGRLSVSSYSNLSSTYPSNQRFRYNLSLNAEHIGNSNLSADTYISFTHKLGESFALNNSLKIYSLGIKYDIGKTATISIGRKININMANIGAVDGLQYEQKSKNFTYGALVGSRPDYFDYSFNPNLLQFGAFISHNIQKEVGNMQTSFAVFNQMNNFKTDRRFAYIQHSNSLVKNVDLFCSAEIDFYTMVNLQPTNSMELTSTYISLRYKPWKKLSLSLSYDARKNVYYYETFKNMIDSILDKETRQGFRFNTIYRPFKYVILGGTAGYRFQKSDSIPTMNANGYLSYTQIPGINASLTLNATALKTRYLNGMIYGASLSRDLFSGKVYSELSYRYVNYMNAYSGTPLIQNIAEISLSWRVAKKLTLSADFEETLEKDNNYGRIYINISQRF
ncbi:MAG: hypothetical protein GZ091_07370 [Paludibacter sp.]|nr:hypothetical protein [Paludibacter sp.]